MMLTGHELSLSGRLNGVSTRLAAGGITAICGPNGAGKSTLLKTLTGLLQCDTGEVRLNDAALMAIPARRRAQSIGYLPQTPEVAWDVSVANLVKLGRLPHRDRGQRAVAQAMAACDLEAFAQRPVSTLSGGERARALLARVLAGEPQWILADEPLAALDLAHQLNLLTVLRAQAEGGCGVVLVLHDLALAMNYADRVIVLADGGLVADDEPHLALSADIVESVWGVAAQWIGEPGKRALVVSG